MCIQFLVFNVHVLALGMEMYVFDSCIQDHHVSWMPLINEELVCAQESGNPHDPNAVVIKWSCSLWLHLLQFSVCAHSPFEAGPLIKNPASLERMVPLTFA